MKTLDEIREELQRPEGHPEFDRLLMDVRAQKAVSVAAQNDILAKGIWCLEQVAETQQFYRQSFEQLQVEKFYDGWCSLEQVELALSRLRPHIGEGWTAYRLDFICDKTSALQSLYPYKLFMSSELIELEKRCNICGGIISIRNPCGHRVGEIYKGEFCYRTVTRCEVVGISVVEKPVNKYAVPFLTEPKAGGFHDHYNYKLVNYLSKRWPSPYHDWTAVWTKALHPKERFGSLRRNDKCPCDSGKKYKACCMGKEGILRPHVVFNFRYALTNDLQTIEFSD
jgi:SEC-C motif